MLVCPAFDKVALSRLIATTFQSPSLSLMKSILPSIMAAGWAGSNKIPCNFNGDCGGAVVFSDVTELLANGCVGRLDVESVAGPGAASGVDCATTAALCETAEAG